MPFAVGEQQETIDGKAEVYLHVWPLATRNDGLRDESVQELELIASHTPNPNHLDPSCPACNQLRGQLQSIARTVVESAAALSTNSAAFEIYTDLASIVCPPGDGQRPSVTVSIYVRDRFEDSVPKGISAALSRLKHSLKGFGIRDR